MTAANKPKPTKAEASPTKKPFDEPVKTGTCVLWYRKGDLDGRPRVAFVTESDPHGVVELTVLPNNNGNCEVVHSCYHKTHLGLHDEFGQPTAAKSLYGCWDFPES